MEPLILGVETATLTGSLCLSRGRQELASHTGEPDVSHSHTLLSDIDQLLLKEKIDLQEIDLFAVATGPGSFTGLRIGLATIKALAATLERPTVGIPTLEAVALAGGVSKTSVALLPAGRGEVFAQLLSVSETGQVTALDNASHIPPGKMLEKYSSLNHVLWCGHGAHVHRDLIEEVAALQSRPFIELAADSPKGTDEGWRVAVETTNLARYCVALAVEKYEKDELELPNALRAIYVRPSDAELKV